MRRLLASALSTAALASGAALVTHGAAAAEPDWDELAQCESSGNWNSTAGHYEGGIQFDPNTWDSYGGNQYASSADQATREQQIAIGRKVLAAQGHGAWPGCSAKTGWENGGTATTHRSAHKSSRSQDHPASHSAGTVQRPAAPAIERQVITVPRQSVPTLGRHAAVPLGGKVWPVVRGDTLSLIAARNGLDWHQLVELNRGVVEDPHWIFPGEQVVIPAPTR